MARRLYHQQLICAQAYLISILQEMQRPFVVLYRQVPTLAGFGCKGKHLFFLWVDMGFELPGLVYKSVPENMVEMAVGVQQQLWMQVMFFNKGSQQVFFPLVVTTGIDDHAVARFIK
jgi:hypothetical protein